MVSFWMKIGSTVTVLKKKLNCSEHGLIWVYYKTVITAIRSVPCGLLLLENQGWDSSFSLTVPH